MKRGIFECRSAGRWQREIYRNDVLIGFARWYPGHNWNAWEITGLINEGQTVDYRYNLNQVMNFLMEEESRGYFADSDTL